MGTVTLSSLQQNAGYRLRTDGIVEVHTPSGYTYYWDKVGNGLYRWYAAAFNDN